MISNIISRIIGVILYWRNLGWYLWEDYGLLLYRSRILGLVFECIVIYYNKNLLLFFVSYDRSWFYEFYEDGFNIGELIGWFCYKF